QDDAKDMRAPPLAVRPHDRRAGAEIDLDLVAGRALHPPEGQRPAAVETLDETANAVVLGRKAVLANQVLEDALGGQPGRKLGLNDRPIRLAQARRRRPGRRCLRAEGRLLLRWPILDTMSAPREVAYFAITGAWRRLAYFALRSAFQARD